MKLALSLAILAVGAMAEKKPTNNNMLKNFRYAHTASGKVVRSSGNGITKMSKVISTAGKSVSQAGKAMTSTKFTTTRNAPGKYGDYLKYVREK